MDSRKITGVRLTDGGNSWSVEYTTEGGMARISIPHGAYEYRAAEYGFDVSDSRSILDVLLHEQFLETDYSHPKFVYNTDESSAREYHLQRIEESKVSSVEFVDSENLMDVIHQSHHKFRNPRLYAEHKNYVDGVRAETTNRVLP